jgi:hypothetical protein
MSIGAGGGAQTVTAASVAKGTVSVRSPDKLTVATPASNALAGPGEADGLGEALGEGESSGGGETLAPWPTPVVVQATESIVTRAPTMQVPGHVTRIPPSLPHAPRAPADVASRP